MFIAFDAFVVPLVSQIHQSLICHWHKTVQSPPISRLTHNEYSAKVYRASFGAHSGCRGRFVRVHAKRVRQTKVWKNEAPEKEKRGRQKVERSRMALSVDGERYVDPERLNSFDVAVIASPFSSRLFFLVHFSDRNVHSYSGEENACCSRSSFPVWRRDSKGNKSRSLWKGSLTSNIEQRILSSPLF